VNVKYVISCGPLSRCVCRGRARWCFSPPRAVRPIARRTGDRSIVDRRERAIDERAMETARATDRGGIARRERRARGGARARGRAGVADRFGSARFGSVRRGSVRFDRATD
jgi:hypothetical protein